MEDEARRCSQYAHCGGWHTDQCTDCSLYKSHDKSRTKSQNDHPPKDRPPDSCCLSEGYVNGRGIRSDGCIHSGYLTAVTSRLAASLTSQDWPFLIRRTSMKVNAVVTAITEPNRIIRIELPAIFRHPPNVPKMHRTVANLARYTFAINESTLVRAMSSVSSLGLQRPVWPHLNPLSRIYRHFIILAVWLCGPPTS